MGEHVRVVARWWIAPLVGWTLFLWTSRIRNVLGDDDLDGFREVQLRLVGAVAVPAGYFQCGG